MTRPWLAVILLVLIFGILENRGDVTDIHQLRSKLLRLKYLFRDTEKGDNEPRKETYLRLIQLYDEFGAKLDDAATTKHKQLLSSRNSVWLRKMKKAGIENILTLYATFRRKLNESNNKILSFNVHQWTDFAETVLKNPNVSVPSTMDRITDIVEDFIISPYKEEKSQICDANQSEQRLLFDLYNMIEFTEIKGFVMMQFSYTLLGLHNNRTFGAALIKTRKEYNLRTNETLRAVKTALALTPRELWRCDPSVHKRGSTYAELKELFQGYIVNEITLDPYRLCEPNCDHYRSTVMRGCVGDEFCSQQRHCNGTIRNCQFIDSHMWICLSEMESSRRYEYIEHENGLVFGSKGTCRKQTIKVNSWWHLIFSHCSYCMCYCDNNNNSSDRYFSLKEATSDVQKNRVVTGIKLTKVNKVIHLQIQEGKLLKRGDILEESVQWRDVDNFTVMDHNVKNGRDYHSLDWENRALDLDDLIAPESHLLTGVRFSLIGSHLHLEIRVTPFDFITGRLMKTSTWLNANNIKDSDDVREARTEFKLTKPDVPTRTEGPGLPDSKPNQYLNFGPTDLEKDAAQTTIPFLDIQPITTNPPLPLSGAGIFHKGSNGSGGFVALRLITYDFSYEINTNVAPPPDF